MTEKLKAPIETKIPHIQPATDKNVVTLGGIHGAELGQTLVQHPEAWSGLHTALAVGLIVSFASWALTKLKQQA